MERNGDARHWMVVAPDRHPDLHRRRNCARLSVHVSDSQRRGRPTGLGVIALSRTARRGARDTVPLGAVLEGEVAQFTLGHNFPHPRSTSTTDWPHSPECAVVGEEPSQDVPRNASLSASPLGAERARHGRIATNTRRGAFDGCQIGVIRMEGAYRAVAHVSPG